MLAVGCCDVHDIIERAFDVAAFHAAPGKLRDVHRRVVVQLLGELDAADRGEGALGGSRTTRPLPAP